jgi:simple sugar transport system permease protein
MAATGAAVPATPRARPEWLEDLGEELLALATALAIALLLGSLIILGYRENPLVVYGSILEYAFVKEGGIGYVLGSATPLIFSALAVAVCFKGGMFNIGVEGQYIVAMMTAAWAALTLDFIPGPLLLWVVILAAMVGGMVWAAIPAILKIKTGAHEVVTTIMLNGVAVSLVAWAIGGPLRYTETGGAFNVNLRTDPFATNARIPDLGHVFGIRSSAHLTWLFPAAVLVAVLVWFVLRRTRLGYEARAVGASAGSARAGGISIGGVQLKLFLLSGALAGLVGMQQLLGEKGFLPVGYEAALGFTGIAVAFLGQNSPVGILFAAILWGILARGDTAVQISTDVPREFIIILQGILIISVVVTYQLARRRLFALQMRKAAEVDHVSDEEPPSERRAEAAKDHGPPESRR